MCPDEPVWPASSSSGGLTKTAKNVVFPIGADTSGTQTGFTGALQRMALAFPDAPLLGRLHIANTGQAGAITLDDIYVGTPVYSAGAWSGQIAASPTKVLPAPVMPSDGSELVTDWFDMTKLWTAADVMQVLSIDFACLATVPLQHSAQMGFTRYRTTGSGLSGEVAAASPALGSLSNTSPFLDIRLEVQFNTSLRVVLVIGDSTTAGYNDTGDAPSVPGPMSSWPMLAGMKNRVLVINAGVGGTATNNWTSAADSKYTRVLPATAYKPDDILIDLGINDANGGVAFATFRTNYQSVINAAKSLAQPNPRVWAATVIQQPRWKPGIVLAGAAAAVTTLQTSIAYANADVVDVDYEVPASKETLTVSGASAGTQAPFTTTFTAATTKAHGQGATINLSTTESRRLDYNQHLRRIPPQVDDVFEFDAATALPGAANVGDPRYWYGGAVIHPGQNAYVAMADQVEIPQL